MRILLRELWSLTLVDSVTIVDAETGALQATLSAPGVMEIGFSPKGSYCITWERLSMH